MPNTISRLVQEVYEAPASELVYRILALVKNRELFKKAFHRKPDPVGLVELADFEAMRRKMFFPDRAVVADWHKNNSSQDAILHLSDTARSSVDGKIYGFSKNIYDYGRPINWHIHPVNGRKWPKDRYWPSISLSDMERGDVKYVWEVNRFPHVYYSVRAYILSGDSALITSFLAQLKSWEEENPYGYGVNWSSGQELAIRSLSWIFALYNFYNVAPFSNEDFQRMQRLLYMHAAHISENIGYSRYAVRNNHLIGEALALFVIGRLFPWFDRSKEWAQQGKALLETDCLEQFFPDGGYCQSSHNYHRLALHYYLWAIRTGEVTGEPFSRKVYEIMAKSADYLNSFVNAADGNLPNWGANDGALLNPWTNCDYSDFRPIISATKYLSSTTRVFDPGPWDEELLWFWGAEAANSPIESVPLQSKSFTESGIHVLRRTGDTFASVRCGTVRNRFGHADQLNMDLSVKGFNLVVDPGSYFYNQDLEFHNYFMGSASHNTVTVDGTDQMLLHRRFKWLYPTKAKLISFARNKVVGEHYGYASLPGGPVHRRSCLFEGEDVVVLDSVRNYSKARHIATIHWLVNSSVCSVEKLSGGIVIKVVTPSGEYWISICTSLPATLSQVAGGGTPEGWFSRYYSFKNPATSFNYSAAYVRDMEFSTLFTASREKAKIHLKDTHFMGQGQQCD